MPRCSRRVEASLFTAPPSTTCTSRTSAASARTPDLVSDALLEKFCLVGTPSDNARRMQWLFDNSVYPIVYPLPRRDRMVEDHHSVLERAVSWTKVLGPTLVEG